MVFHLLLTAIGETGGMSNYLRPVVTGASVFFTVNLVDRSSDLLVREIGQLREAVRVTREVRPFQVDAWVVLPDHLHCVWTLPDGDSDYSVRWGAIKARFVMGVRRAGFSPPPELPVVQSGRFAGLKPGPRQDKREVAVWQRRFWDEVRKQTIRGIVCSAEPAEPTSGIRRIMTRISGIVGVIR